MDQPVCFKIIAEFQQNFDFSIFAQMNGKLLVVDGRLTIQDFLNLKNLRYLQSLLPPFHLEHLFSKPSFTSCKLRIYPLGIES